MREYDSLCVTQTEFNSLKEYSSSIPTGTTIGKRWKRNCSGNWFIGEYVDINSETEIGIKWWRPVIVK